jgi:hypothetical protein
VYTVVAVLYVAELQVKQTSRKPEAKMIGGKDKRVLHFLSQGLQFGLVAVVPLSSVLFLTQILGRNKEQQPA